MGQDDNSDDSTGCNYLCASGGTDSNELIYSEVEFNFGGDGTSVVPVGSSVFAGCYWETVEEGEELIIGRPDVASINLTGSVFDEDHYIVYCPDLTGFDAYTIYPVGDPPPTPVIEDMVGDAYNSTPVIAFNPLTSPNGDDDIPFITRVPTFLWVDDVAWATPVTATSVAPGFQVWTTATPREARWSGGDEPVTCSDDDMHPYVFGIGGDDAQPSNCVMVYKR